ncbi:MAG: LEA type 2 family protein [Treponema sp.]|nr:LEA type 2 family protein [Treponema sp.]
MRDRFCLLLSLFVGFLFWSCQSFSSVIEEPSVSLNSVNIAGINFSGVDLIVNVDVQNPNAFSIPMPNIDWELFVNEASFLQGNLPSSQSIRRRQTVTLAFPVSFTFDGLYRSFASLVELREAAYDIALGVSFPLPLLADRVFSLDFSGVLPLPQFPALSFGQMRITQIDFAGIELAWDVNVENTNMFPIPFPNLDWDYEVNGVPVMRSNFAGSGHIAAGAAGAAVITAGLAYADILRALGGAANVSEAAGNLSLGINPADIGFPLALMEAGSVQNILNIRETIPILRPPEISFQGITRRALGLNRMEFAVIWAVENRNSFGFEIGEFNYEFRVNGGLWGQGNMANPPRALANSRTLIPVNIVLTAPAIVQELVTIISQGANVNYAATGNMSFLADLPGLEELNFPLDFSGNTRILTP